MASNFPASIQTFTDPLSTDTLSGHAALHTTTNDTLEAVQNKVGVDNDTDPTSFDFRIRTLEDEVTPTGSVTMFAGAAAPSGWFLCNGQAISRTTYATLFALVGTTYGAGNGSSTFNVPDFRNRVPVGAGTSYSLNQAVGNLTQDITLAATNLPKHTHKVTPATTSVVFTDPGHSHPEQGRTASQVLANHYLQRQGGSTPNWDFYSGSTVRIDSIQYPATASAFTGISGTVSIPEFNSGDGGAALAATAITVNLLQPSRGINFIIKV
jgi:microcystin-dependent protein